MATARYGRTLGKMWLHIRPVRVGGGPVGWGRAFGRVGIHWLSALFGWLGLIDPLWCLWDANRQCLHDKVADTIVVND
ncbi:MAG TPA: RDD family protein [Acidimicrobiales bacterium]|nr:RDD family protein [Acidimicrobiales bacterium]